MEGELFARCFALPSLGAYIERKKFKVPGPTWKNSVLVSGGGGGGQKFSN